MPSPSWINRFELRPNCWVYVPSDESIKDGKAIKKNLFKEWSRPYYYWHLRPGGHVQALKIHLQSNSFIRTDIAQFFNSINRSRVTRELKKFYFPYKLARDLACKSVVPSPFNHGKFVLPFGFVQSPILASICLANSRLGSFFDDLVSKKYIVSVYMDDIIISDAGVISKSDMVATYKKLFDVANRSGFPLNSSKTVGPVKKITAFNIELSNLRLSITNSRFDEFVTAGRIGNDAVIQGIKIYLESVSIKQKIKFESLI